MSCCRKDNVPCDCSAASCCFFCRWDGPAAIESSCTGSRPWTQMQTQRRKWITVRLVGLWLLTGGGRKWVGLREREKRRERTCHLRRSNDQCNSAGMERTPTFSPTVEGALSLLFRHRFLYSRLYRFVFVLFFREGGLSPFCFLLIYLSLTLCAYPLATVFIVVSCYINDRPRWVYSPRLEGSAIMKGTNYKYCC